ncbi:MAG: cupin domain-containing protein [Chloroflexi bacterium]|nr:cupin domain-containing protein [Chloroflexota bacterium]
MSQAVVIHSEGLNWETWDASQLAARGRVLWKTLFSRGLTDTDSLTVGVALVHPGDALNPHHHAPSEIYFILRGEGVMTLGETEQLVRAGDAVFIPGNVRHGIANRSAQAVEFLYAFARDAFAEVVYHFPE